MATAAEVMVRMGELAVSRTPGDVLVSIGLGSCIGLCLIDRRRHAVGLAHVMLPSGGPGEMPGKFAPSAVPALVEELAKLGAVPRALEAVLVGGAQMFSFGNGGAGKLDVGARNEQAAREALAAARIPVIAEATGGSTGRTVRVAVDAPRVVVKEAGAGERELFAAGSTGGSAAR
ncbi:MAG: chemotaxis protein CheD [Thermoleophilales bacterium]|jgi:chemotaxis protein CheD|nr:chemotaxis protein CheD [Thermoleophilales bacterium]